jgi:4-hydroxy-tetrahydrodipicolinate synthase
MRFFCVAAAALSVAPANAFAPINNQYGEIRAPSSSQLAASLTTSQLAAVGSNANERTPMRQGSYVALVTPMTETGAINIPSLRSLLQFHLESGTDGLCILGTTGEASVLTMEERKRVLDVAVEEVKGKIPILVGTGTIDPEHVREQTLQAIDCGCDASLVVTPYYVKPPQRGLIRHFEEMADLGLPVCIYNVPGRTGSDFLPESIGKVAGHPNIVAVKEATGDVSRVAKIHEACEANGVPKDKLLLLSGDDGSTDKFVMSGGDGCISVTANVAPARMHNLMMAALKKDAEEVERINAPLRRLHQDEFCEANPIPIKWALKRMGNIDCAYLRPPLDELSPEYHGLVEDAMKEAGLLF